MGRPFLRPTVGSVCAVIATVLTVVLSGGGPAADASDAVQSADPSTVDPDVGLGDGQSILDLDIEQLGRVDVVVPAMDVEVTSVSKQESTVGHSPAAIFVITSEMIRRSGATTIPDLLRMVPGLEVAHIDAHTWAITSRGFNGWLANKLLVLIDGRSVYAPLYSGTYWDTQDTVLEDIERIEVIRGPGGTLWGANAVNGVINIITKKARDTQGTLISAGGGSQDRALSTIRYGGNNGRGLYWRVYGKHSERGTEFNVDGAHDDWRMGQGGFRVDWDLDRCDCNTLTVQGDFYGGSEGQSTMTRTSSPPYTQQTVQDESVSGANVLTRWTHVAGEESDWSVQLYFDRVYRYNETPTTILLDTLDVEFQHRFPLARRHSIIWGLDYRQVQFYTPTQAFGMSYHPPERTANLFSGFVQDEIALIDDRLSLTVGSKFEHNDFSGFEYQPSARLLWTPDPQHSAWAAVSRAVRTPVRFEHDVVANFGPMYSPGSLVPTFIRLLGSDDVRSEQLVAYEIGYRTQATERFAWDVATFFNVYEDLSWSETGAPFLESGYLVLPCTIGNSWRGQTYGAEVAAQWQAGEAWRLSASYSFLQILLQAAHPGIDEGYADTEHKSPHNQVRLYSSWDLGRCWELDMGLRYVDSLPSLQVPDYISMDLRLAWTPRENLEVALVGQNLLHNHHPEFGDEHYGLEACEVRRSVFGKLSYQY